uniref:Secreted protein n=1 Tax=Romanomermis culicivorax TaxID=13658 RepID=A0A915JUJ6_ROMCU
MQPADAAATFRRLTVAVGITTCLWTSQKFLRFEAHLKMSGPRIEHTKKIKLLGSSRARSQPCLCTTKEVIEHFIKLYIHFLKWHKVPKTNG